AVSRYRLRAVGPGIGEVEVVRGGLRGAVFSDREVIAAHEGTIPRSITGCWWHITARTDWCLRRRAGNEGRIRIIARTMKNLDVSNSHKVFRGASPEPHREQEA